MTRFRYNPETLSYEKVERKKRYILLRIAVSTGLMVILAAAMLFLRDEYGPSGRQQALVEEQQTLVTDIHVMNEDLNRFEQELQRIAVNDDQLFRVYFEVDPLGTNMRQAGIGGANKYRWLSNHKYGDLLQYSYLNMDRMERKLVMQSTSFDDLIELAVSKEEMMAARPAIQPISMKDLTRFGSSFGMRDHPILKIRRMHEGIDLTAPLGTNIYATADGKVLQAGYRAGGFGKKVYIDHGFGYRSLYGHCNEVLVEPGQWVKRGEVIARVGSTGLSKSPHLHYEVHLNGRAVNPINYYSNDLSGEEYESMIEMLANADPSFDIN